MAYEQVNVRLESDIKQTTKNIFTLLGLSAKDALRMFYYQVAMQRALPFAVKIIEQPNHPEDMEDFKKRVDAFTTRSKKTLEGLSKR